MKKTTGTQLAITAAAVAFLVSVLKNDKKKKEENMSQGTFVLCFKGELDA